MRLPSTHGDEEGGEAGEDGEDAEDIDECQERLAGVEEGDDPKENGQHTTQHHRPPDPRDKLRIHTVPHCSSLFVVYAAFSARSHIFHMTSASLSEHSPRVTAQPSPPSYQPTAASVRLTLVFLHCWG